jgi:transposase InsO family protein
LKVEAIHGEKMPTREHTKGLVFEYIDVYYNRKRLHSKLGYLCPETFEAKKAASQGIRWLGAGSLAAARPTSAN